MSSHQSLTASTVATVSVTGAGTALEIVNRSGAAEVYATLDQSAPTVGGANTIVLPATAGHIRRLSIVEANALAGKYANASGNYTVKVISSGTPTVSVQAW